jgi:hypothetical protein
LGHAADVESTALALYALLRTPLRAQESPPLVADGLNWLAEQRDGSGRWGALATDWLTARTFLAAVDSVPSPAVSSTVSISVDGIEAPPVSANAEGTAAPQSRTFEKLSKGYNDIILSAVGKGQARYRAVGTYVLPWSQVAPAAVEDEAFSLEVRYNRTELAVAETITATVNMTRTRPGAAQWVVLELGLPPGLEVVGQPWHEWVEDGTALASRREGERIIVYLANLPSGAPIHLAYHLRARFPLSVRTLPARAYDAANPRQVTVREPVRIQVE